MKEQKVINIMLGGQFPSELPSGLWCGVDKGAIYLIKKGIVPILSCGDFDSISMEQRTLVEFNSKYILVKESQYLTDADFALEKVFELYPSIEVINIYGATGKRLDHFYGNVLLLNSDKYSNIKMNIVDDNNIISVAKKGKSIFKKKSEYKYFSVVPIYENTIMTIKNSKYEAENLELTLTRPNATSNEFFEDKDISLEVNKNVLVIYSKD